MEVVTVRTRHNFDTSILYLRMNFAKSVYMSASLPGSWVGDTRVASPPRFLKTEMSAEEEKYSLKAPVSGSTDSKLGAGMITNSKGVLSTVFCVIGGHSKKYAPDEMIDLQLVGHTHQ